MKMRACGTALQMDGKLSAYIARSWCMMSTMLRREIFDLAREFIVILMKNVSIGTNECRCPKSRVSPAPLIIIISHVSLFADAFRRLQVTPS
jgi:hypothetical protein